MFDRTKIKIKKKINKRKKKADFFVFEIGSNDMVKLNITNTNQSNDK